MIKPNYTLLFEAFIEMASLLKCKKTIRKEFEWVVESTLNDGSKINISGKNGLKYFDLGRLSERELVFFFMAHCHTTLAGINNIVIENPNFQLLEPVQKSMEIAFFRRPILSHN